MHESAPVTPSRTCRLRGGARPPPRVGAGQRRWATRPHGRTRSPSGSAARVMTHSRWPWRDPATRCRRRILPSLTTVVARVFRNQIFAAEAEGAGRRPDSARWGSTRRRGMWSCVAPHRASGFGLRASGQPGHRTARAGCYTTHSAGLTLDTRRRSTCKPGGRCRLSAGSPSGRVRTVSLPNCRAAGGRLRIPADVARRIDGGVQRGEPAVVLAVADRRHARGRRVRAWRRRTRGARLRRLRGAISTAS